MVRVNLWSKFVGFLTCDFGSGVDVGTGLVDFSPPGVGLAVWAGFVGFGPPGSCIGGGFVGFLLSGNNSGVGVGSGLDGSSDVGSWVDLVFFLPFSSVADFNDWTGSAGLEPFDPDVMTGLFGFSPLVSTVVAVLRVEAIGRVLVDFGAG